jgi:hypothetical protein
MVFKLSSPPLLLLLLLLCALVHVTCGQQEHESYASIPLLDFDEATLSPSMGPSSLFPTRVETRVASPTSPSPSRLLLSSLRTLSSSAPTIVASSFPPSSNDDDSLALQHVSSTKNETNGDHGHSQKEGGIESKPPLNGKKRNHRKQYCFSHHALNICQLLVGSVITLATFACNQWSRNMEDDDEEEEEEEEENEVKEDNEKKMDICEKDGDDCCIEAMEEGIAKHDRECM